MKLVIWIAFILAVVRTGTFFVTMLDSSYGADVSLGHFLAEGFIAVVLGLVVIDISKS